MIDTKKAKSRLLSIAFSGKLRTYDSRYKSNTEIDSIHSSIKKYKKVSDAEKLIDAPEDWAWSRLGYITFNHGQTVPQQSFSYIDVGTLDNEHQRLSRTENIIDAKDAPSRARKIVKRGDVIYSTVRPYLHNICVIDKDFSEVPIASTAFCVMHANSSVLLNRFLFYWLLTPEFDKFSNGNPSKGMLYPAIGKKALLNAVIPVPSIEEQKTIVGTLDEVFALIDSIDEDQTRYTSDVAVLKSKVIDAGIQGRLTEQLPEDGTAQELVAQIQEEKTLLIKEGKIKKQKPLPPIKPEEMPYKIPENWMWVRWGDIINIVSARRVHQSDWKKEGIPFYRAREIAKLADEGFVKNDLFISEDLYNKFSESGVPHEGDLIVSAVGTLGKTYVVKGNDKFYYKDASVLCFENYVPLNPSFLKYIMESGLMRTQISSNSGGTTVDTLTMVRAVQYLLPLPPLAEQQRIAERIEEILEAAGE